MTVKECYEQAVAFLPEEPDENMEMEKFAVKWCNMLLAECLGYENIFRRANGLSEFSVAPKVHSENDEIPFNERLVAAAFPYGIARFVFRENDDIYGSNEFYQLYVNALSEATPLETVEIEDIYR